jgi:hypothetical protein
MKWRRSWAWVKAQYNRTSLPVLFVSILILTVAVANYCLQQSANRPELVSTNGDINVVRVHPKLAELHWHNVGRQPARRGAVTIFTFSDGKRQTKLGQAQIFGAGTNVIPGYNGAENIEFGTDQLGDELLACVTYVGDDGEPYSQAFLYHQEPVQNNVIDLSELAPPKYNAVCPRPNA